MTRNLVATVGAAFSTLVIACASGSHVGRTAATTSSSAPDTGQVEDPIQVLRSRSPGLSITRTADGGIAVNMIQPPSSFMANQRPLVLVDDVPFQTGPGGELSGLNVNDIVFIRALRKPEDIAVYGTRGASGVILIKTKKPGT
jgi:hypothetical protein